MQLLMLSFIAGCTCGLAKWRLPIVSVAKAQIVGMYSVFDILKFLQMHLEFWIKLLLSELRLLSWSVQLSEHV